MRLWVYAVRRIILAIPVLIGAMTVLFVVFGALPAQASVRCGGPPSQPSSPCSPTVPCPQDPSKLCPNPLLPSGENSLGLNQPVYVQWFLYLGNALTFHWGSVAWGSAIGTGETGSGLPSLAGQSVSGLIAEFLPYSLELLILTFAFTLLIVVPIRSRARARPSGPADCAARALTISGYGIPLFLVGALVLTGTVVALGGPSASSPICGSGSTVFLDFYGSWPTPGCTALYGTTHLNVLGFPNWLGTGYISTPTGFPTLDALLHGNVWLALDTVLRMVLPALVLAFIAVAVILRSVRYSSLERESGEYLRAARAQGLPESEVRQRFEGRSTLAEVTAGLGPALVVVLGMLPVVEILFNLWGVGRLIEYSVIGEADVWDFGVLFGTMLTFVFLLVVFSLAMDVVRAWLDPRFRVGGGDVQARTRPSSVGPSRPADCERAFSYS